VVYGVAFSSNNVQRKVLYANVCYRTAKWSFPTGAPEGTRHAFPMTSTVSFVPIDQTAVYTQKPHPPLAIPLSENIFYPFVTSGAEGAVAPAGGGALAVGLAAAVAVGLLWMGSM
jgi:tectonic-1/3